MTANHTPKMNLMSPVDSDQFSSSDFADTMGKIDNAPGTALVANFNALTALGWGTNQHGRKVIQTDNLAEWIWVNPSGSGSWRRMNSLGLLNRTVQGANVSTSAVSGNGIRVVQTGNVTAAGGRWWHVSAYLGLDNTSGADGMVAVSLLDNGSVVKYAGYRAGAPYFSDGNHTSLDWYFNPAQGSVHNLSIYIRSESGSVAQGGHGTSTARDCILTVVEI